MGAASDDNLLSSKAVSAYCERSLVCSLVQTSDTETGQGIEVEPQKTEQ